MQIFTVNNTNICCFIEHVLQLIETEENRRKVNKTLPRSDFAINYRLDCSNLCSDFKYEIFVY